MAEERIAREEKSEEVDGGYTKQQARKIYVFATGLDPSSTLDHSG